MIVWETSSASGVVGSGTQLADQFLQIRLGGDMALLQAVSARVLAAEDAAPGTVLDHAFLDQRCEGLDAFRAHLADLDEDEYGVIKAPTLIIWGDEDKWVEPKLADRLVNAIPDARLVRLAGVARLVPEENPEHLSELLLDFIKRRAAA